MPAGVDLTTAEDERDGTQPARCGLTLRPLTCGRRRRRAHPELYSTVLQVAKLRRALDGPFEIRGCL